MEFLEHNMNQDYIAFVPICLSFVSRLLNVCFIFVSRNVASTQEIEKLIKIHR